MRRIGTWILIIVLFLLTQNAQAGWTPAKRLTWTSGMSWDPAIAVDSSGHLHVVWADYPLENSEIYYKKSTDGGASWTSSKRFTWTSGDSQAPAIAVDPSDHLHVIWQDHTPGNYEIYYKKSVDGGATWTSNQRLTWISGVSAEPDVAVDSSGHLHIVWRDTTTGNGEIYYKQTTDGGVTWKATKRLTWTPGSSSYPAMAVDSSQHLHVVWHDNSPGNVEIYCVRSTNGGSGWSTSKRLTWTSGTSYVPRIAADSSGGVHLVWFDDDSGNYEVYYRRSPDGGATWLWNQRLSWNPGDSWDPAITVDSSDRLHVVWHDFTPGNDDIYYKKSTNGGAAWTLNQRLTWNSGASRVPVIAADPSGHLHLLWHDETPGNYEIFYKNGN